MIERTVKYCVYLSGILILVACARSPQVSAIPVEDFVGSVPLEQSAQTPDESALLNLGVLIFEAEPIDPQAAQLNLWLVEAIAEKEIHYLPFVLRKTLVQSNQWGAVRVLPEADPSLDLQVTGSIVRSDGSNLVLNIVATDSAGRTWVDKTYADETTNDDFRDINNSSRAIEGADIADPFQDLFDRVANDLLAYRDSLTAQQLADIAVISQMKYASDLSPSTFARTLQTDDAGLYRVNSLLAEDDPMLARVADIKLRHYLYIDTVDEYYAALYEEMQPLYDLWRSYSREQIFETRERRGSSDIRGSGLDALTQSYNRFKWAKIYEQEFTDLALGFNNEIAPAILELNRQVRGLSGNVEEQYVQWREILRELFEVETGQELSTNSI
jgi:hypothetical protein